MPRLLSISTLLTAVVATACSGEVAEDDSSGARADEVDELFEARIEAVKTEVRELITKASADRTTITAADLDGLIKLVIEGTTDLQRMEIANHFDHVGLAVFGSDNFEPWARAGTQLQVLYWAMPRNLFATDPDTGERVDDHGQTMKESINVGPLDDNPAPLVLTVTGAAKRPYDLEFSLAESRLTVSVPAGSTAQETAQRIADAITANADIVLDELSERDGRSLDTAGELDALIGISATSSGGKVTIAIENDA